MSSRLSETFGHTSDSPLPTHRSFVGWCERTQNKDSHHVFLTEAETSRLRGRGFTRQVHGCRVPVKSLLPPRRKGATYVFVTTETEPQFFTESSQSETYILEPPISPLNKDNKRVKRNTCSYDTVFLPTDLPRSSRRSHSSFILKIL